MGCCDKRGAVGIISVIYQKHKCMTKKCHRHCEETKQSDDIKNTDCFVILPRNDVFL
jgi:hypothetical protein